MPGRVWPRGVRAPGATTAVALCASLLAGACGDGGSSIPTGTVARPFVRPPLAQDYRPSGNTAAGDAFVHLFQWTWANVATECEQHLGPAGWKAVQVSPPSEHITGGAWWTVYQPVQYSLSRSRSGTAAEFADMVSRCRAAGVDVYVDIVLNHMSGASSGTGTNGTAFTKYNYPGLWTQADFHPSCSIDYGNATSVHDCELVGLADLNTGLSSVRRKLADQVVALSALGVAGFRIDAAKHIHPWELDSIVTLAHRDIAAAGRPLPYWFSEVIDYGGDVVGTRAYFGLGYASGGASDITEFRFRGTGERFTGANGRRAGELSTFSGPQWGLMPSDKAVVFLENHDTARDGGISYRDGQAFRLANVWMLAQPYGYPSVYSGYGFSRPGQRDNGPPHDAAAPRAVTCAASLETAANGEWTCEHRDPMIARMVRFRRETAGTPVANAWSDGGDALAFSRGSAGFVAINNGASPVTATLTTGLAPGTYCDILGGGLVAGACAGTGVTVGAGGAASITLPARSAVALLAGDRL
jgi:alpha-amylase